MEVMISEEGVGAMAVLVMNNLDVRPSQRSAPVTYRTVSISMRGCQWRIL